MRGKIQDILDLVMIDALSNGSLTKYYSIIPEAELSQLKLFDPPYVVTGVDKRFVGIHGYSKKGDQSFNQKMRQILDSRIKLYDSSKIEKVKDMPEFKYLFPSGVK